MKKLLENKNFISRAKYSVCILLCLVIFQGAFINNYLSGVIADSSQVISVDMSNENDVKNNFVPYYVKRFGSSVRKEELDTHWKFEDNCIKRVNDIILDNETENVASLSFQKYKVMDFEVSLDYKLGGMNYTWLAVAIRQQVPGKYYLEENGGGGVFVQENGKVTLWGTAFGSQVIEKPVQDIDYESYAWHNLKIRAVGTLIKVWVDDVLQLEYLMTSASLANGFVTLMSVNNDTSIKNFKFQNLTKTEQLGVEMPKSTLNGMNIDEIAEIID